MGQSAARLPDGQHDFEFQLLGLAGLRDPARPDVAAAVAECRRAGVRVVMITGDYPGTALAVAREVGPGVTGAEPAGGDAGADDGRQQQPGAERLGQQRPAESCGIAVGHYAEAGLRARMEALPIAPG
jgi:hypothetical protein